VQEAKEEGKDLLRVPLAGALALALDEDDNDAAGVV
jgi:hypothetical protein